MYMFRQGKLIVLDAGRSNIIDILDKNDYIT